MYGFINDYYSIILRWYVGMVLINLIFGDVVNKVMLCFMKGCMRVFVV